MQPTTSNGNMVSAREMLDSLGKVVEQLEADGRKQQDEIKQLRTERDEARFMLAAVKQAFAEMKEWETFNPNEYTVTIDDLIADIRSK